MSLGLIVCHEKLSLSQIALTQGLRWVPRRFKDKVNIKVKVNIYYPARARAVTGRGCPHSVVGEDFLARRPGFFLRKQP